MAQILFNDKKDTSSMKELLFIVQGLKKGRMWFLEARKSHKNIKF